MGSTATVHLSMVTVMAFAVLVQYLVDSFDERLADTFSRIGHAA